MTTITGDKIVLFQTYYRIDPWSFEPAIEYFNPIRFDYSSNRFSLYIRYKRSFQETEEPHILIQTLHRKDNVPDDVQAVFSGDAKIEGTLEDIFSDEKPDGLNRLPECYRDFILSLHCDMDRMATELFNVVRWRMGIVGGPLLLDSHWASMRWHDVSKGEPIVNESGFLNRQMISGIFTNSIPEMQNVVFDQQSCENVEELLQQQSQQPLYHDLFREAWQNQDSNPRSALVMGIAAAETGFKTALIDLNPSATWIIENLQSPPLDRMLREYMSQLPTRLLINGEVRRPPKSIIGIIKRGIEIRNKLVHGREVNLSLDNVRKTLEAVRDLLYLLDYYRGHEWALERITPTVVEKLRNE